MKPMKPSLFSAGANGILASFLNVYVAWSLQTHEQWVLADY